MEKEREQAKESWQMLINLIKFAVFIFLIFETKKLDFSKRNIHIQTVLLMIAPLFNQKFINLSLSHCLYREKFKSKSNDSRKNRYINVQVSSQNPLRIPILT